MFDRYFFYPRRDVNQTPGDFGISFEDIYFSTIDGVRLNAWFVRGSTEVTMLWFHGNGGSLADRAPSVDLYHLRLGCNLFLLDYRGFGLSEGKPTEKGVYRDATAAFQYLQSRQASGQKIVYFGHSLGGAVAIELASRFPPDGLVLMSTFSSAADMARMVMRRIPVHLLVRSKFRSSQLIKEIHCPVLVIHGGRDQVVPPSQGRKLYDLAPGPKRWLELPGSDHSDLEEIGGEQLMASLDDFFGSL